MTHAPRARPTRQLRAAGPLAAALCVAAARAAEGDAAVGPPVPAASASASAPASAVEPEAPKPVTRYVLGLAVGYAPEYSGAERQTVTLRPLWAWQRGRWRVSTSGANTVLGFGSNETDAGAGASADIALHNRWRFGAGLRLDNGRRSADSADLAGVPDVRRTVRLRLYSSYTLDAHWSAIATVSDDLLGRGGGASTSVDVGYGHALGRNAVWNVGAGLRFGDTRYLRARYGVSPEVAAATGRIAYDPHAGLEAIRIGAGITAGLSPNWIAFASIGASTLRGDAAASPLTRARSTAQLSIGIGWRNRP